MNSALRCERDSVTSLVDPLTDGDERDLVWRIAARDLDAMRDLYFLYHRRLARFLASITTRRELLDEIVNETFVIVWRRAAEFRGDSSVSTWLMGIAWRHALASIPREQHPVASPASSKPNAAIEEGGGRDALERALSTLSAEQRALIELAYVGGYSCEEIGVIMKYPASTVQTRLFHARCRLRMAREAAVAPGAICAQN